jgi:hypothetical protein
MPCGQASSPGSVYPLPSKSDSDEVQLNSCITIRETKDGMIMWHLEIASDDFQFQVAEPEATRHKWLQNKSLDYL